MKSWIDEHGKIRNEGVSDLEREAIRQYRRERNHKPHQLKLVHDNKTIGGAAPSTVEAVMYELRTYGTQALTRTNCQRRLTELDDKQLDAVIVRLFVLRPKYPAITDELLQHLNRILQK